MPSIARPLDPTQPKLLLMRRSLRVRSHKGQIGFPGGHREPGDLNPSQTALRESFEEVGLNPETVEIRGSPPAVTSLNGKAVIPIVGIADLNPLELSASPDEVAKIIVAPIHNF